MTLFEKAENSQELKGFRAKIGEIFSRAGLSPNQWTVLTLVAAAIASIFIASGQLVAGALLIIVSGILDLVDGAVARHTGRVTKEGAYIDTVADRYAEFLYILPLVFLNLPGVLISIKAWAIIYLAGSLITTYVKAAAKEKELGIGEIRGGILERAERVGIYVIGLLLGSFNPLILSYVVVVLAVLAHVSALQRIQKTLEMVNSKK